MTLDKCIVLRIGTLTGCPLCRESHPLCRLKNPTVISIWLLVGFHPATRSVQSTPADNTRKRVLQYIEKERTDLPIVICRPTGAKWPPKKPPKRSPTRARRPSKSLPTAAYLVWYEPVISTWYETFSRSNRFSGSDASFIILTKSVKWRESRARTENLQNAVKPHHCSKCYCVCDHKFIQATH